MKNFLRFLPIFVSPLLGLLAVTHSGWLVIAGPLFTWVIIPLLDQLICLDKENREDGRWAPLMRVLPAAFVPAQLALLSFGLHRLSSMPLGWESLGLAWGLSIGTAIGILVAHELMHRSGAVEQRLAEVLMATASYTHFCIEHVHGHHKRVGTPDDPASARLGESLYRFLPRSLVGSWASAWGIETTRLARRGLGPWSWHSRMVRYLVAQGALVATLGIWLGPAGVGWFLLQSALAVLLLENINYVEHYGLFREKLPSGAYERVRPEHSWNASHAASNSMMLSLARHSDHHAFVTRPYSELRHWEGAPQLPGGYANMTLLALLPPLWFRVMNPRVLALRGATAIPEPDSASFGP